MWISRTLRRFARSLDCSSFPTILCLWSASTDYGEYLSELSSLVVSSSAPPLPSTAHRWRRGFREIPDACRIGSTSGSLLLRWYAPLQFFKPVQHEVDLRDCC